MGLAERNRKERIRFVELWASYVKERSDREWSRQQNVIIDSCFPSAKMSLEEYLRMKDSQSGRYLKQRAYFKPHRRK